MNKKQTQQLLASVGCSTFYSGKQRTMFVQGITQEILDGYNLETNGFTLKVN